LVIFFPFAFSSEPQKRL